MRIALITAFAVGFSTVIGSVMSFWIKDIPHKVNDAILSFAAGVMLAASFFSLLLPAVEFGGDLGYVKASAGLIVGALLISFMDKAIPHIHSITKTDASNKNLNRVMLFLIAIAIHNFPEGLAVGVSFGNGDAGNAFSLAAAISLQNIPEGMITILPLILAGVKKRTAFLVALGTGLTEVIGVLLGYLTVQMSLAALPYILAGAGGTMIYVISNDMIPETHSHGYEKIASFSLISGCVVMLLITYVSSII